eukprot:gene11262-2047_t
MGPEPSVESIESLEMGAPWAVQEKVPFNVRLYSFEDFPSSAFLRMSEDMSCDQGHDFTLAHSPSGMHSSVATVSLPEGVYYACLGGQSSKEGPTYFPIRDVKSGCIRPISVGSDGLSAGTGAGAAVVAVAAVGGILGGSPVGGIHALRAIRGAICKELSVNSGFEEGLAVLLEPAGEMFPDAPEIANVAALTLLIVLVAGLHAMLVCFWKIYKGIGFIPAAMVLWFPFIPWLVIDLTWDSVLISSLKLVSATAPEPEEASDPPFVMQPSDAAGNTDNAQCHCVVDQCSTDVCDGTGCVMRSDGIACTTGSLSAGVCQQGACIAPDYSADSQCIPPDEASRVSAKHVAIRSKLVLLVDPGPEDDASDTLGAPTPEPVLPEEPHETSLRYVGYFVGAAGLGSVVGDRGGIEEEEVLLEAEKEESTKTLKDPLGVVDMEELPIQPKLWQKIFFTQVLWLKYLPPKWSPEQADYVLENDHPLQSLHGFFFDNLRARAYWWTFVFNLFLLAVMTVPYIVPFCIPSILIIIVACVIMLILLLIFRPFGAYWETTIVALLGLAILAAQILRLLIITDVMAAETSSTAMEVIYWSITVTTCLPVIFGVLDMTLGARLASRLLRQNALIKRKETEMGRLFDGSSEDEEAEDEEDEANTASNVSTDDGEYGRRQSLGDIEAKYTRQLSVDSQKFPTTQSEEVKYCINDVEAQM